MKALIVDDEPLARQLIREYLADFPQIQVLTECGDGESAIKTINAERPDLVFLDVQMPGLSGFEVLGWLDFMPAIIFSTAYDQFALRAFEINAVDYLLKPYERERFAQAVRRALERKGRINLDSFEGLLRQTTAQDRFLVRVGRQIVPVATEDILWIEAAGDYATLHATDSNHLCSAGLGELEKRLDPRRFLRVHRSAIVAVNAIAHLESDGEGGYFATLKNDARVRVSRSRANQIRHLIV